MDADVLFSDVQFGTSSAEPNEWRHSILHRNNSTSGYTTPEFRILILPVTCSVQNKQPNTSTENVELKVYGRKPISLTLCTLLTGSTGSCSANALAKLLEDDAI